MQVKATLSPFSLAGGQRRNHTRVDERAERLERWVPLAGFPGAQAPCRLFAVSHSLAYPHPFTRNATPGYMPPKMGACVYQKTPAGTSTAAPVVTKPEPNARQQRVLD